MNANRQSNRSRRRGALIQEAMIAIAVAAAVFAGVAQLVGVVAHQRRVGQQQSVALREASNLMEDLMSRPWSELVAEETSNLRPSDVCERCLPDAEVRVDITAEDADTRRIQIQVDWLNVAQQRGEPVSLVAWRFRNGEAQQ